MTNSPANTVLPPGQQLAAPGKWPFVGERSPVELAEPWSVEVCGLVDRPVRLSLEDLARLPQVERAVDIHCVTRWSKLGMRFGGVTLQSLLDLTGCKPAARFVSFVARSPREHSTSLALGDALQLGSLVVLTAEGQPLLSEHGGPVRTVVPGRYFYKSLKWLKRIELLAEDRLGYWEAVAGYHNHADPWKEQRFIASSITRQKATELMASRVFTGDLRGIDARGRDLSGLQAAGALLRDADFREAKLMAADFTRANLSIAKLRDADLRQASFRDADVEGVDFCGADLRGADLRGATLFGSTFVDEAAGLAAKIDATTQFGQTSSKNSRPRSPVSFAGRSVCASGLPGLRGPQSLPAQALGPDDPADFACRHERIADDFESMTHVKCIALAAVLLLGCLPIFATAGPPSYLLLRDPESPGPKLQPGYPGSVSYDVRSYGYAYGYFGIAPRSHASRSFGINRMYTQWSRW